MASQAEIDFTYTLTDRLFRLSIGDLGDFEHFCSTDQYRAGEQDRIYADLFRGMAALIPPGGRFFLQTMVFGKNMIPSDQVDVHAPRFSDAHVLGLLGKTFPGSWLPAGPDQVERCAEPHFRLVTKESGRLDYIETIRQWRARFARFGWRKGVLYLTLIPWFVRSADFRYAFTSGVSANTIAFERELLDHFRFVFEKR